MIDDPLGKGHNLRPVSITIRMLGELYWTSDGRKELLPIFVKGGTEERHDGQTARNRETSLVKLRHFPTISNNSTERSLAIEYLLLFFLFFFLGTESKEKVYFTVIDCLGEAQWDSAF